MVYGSICGASCERLLLQGSLAEHEHAEGAACARKPASNSYIQNKYSSIPNPAVHAETIAQSCQLGQSRGKVYTKTHKAEV